MFDHLQTSRLPRQRRCGAGDRLWLSMLVDGFEQACSSNLRGVPCTEPVLLALMAQLARPALPRDGRGSDFRRLN
jgi:hypothetical protein